MLCSWSSLSGYSGSFDLALLIERDLLAVWEIRTRAKQRAQMAVFLCLIHFFDLL